MKRPHDQANMSACNSCKPLVLLLSVACVCYLASPAASEQNCSVANCEVLTVGENLESEFRLKAYEKGVRIIYLNLKIGNSSYNPLDLPDEILPDRWVWARSNNEPMLSLPFDFDILSLGLLNYQVRSMTVPLRDEPSGCLARLNSTCQNMAVGRALLNNVTRDNSIELSSKTGVVCVLMIMKNLNELWSISYHCCSSDDSSINCDLPVAGSNWFNTITSLLYVLSVIALLFSPGCLLLLPDVIFNLQYERDMEDMHSNTVNDVNELAAINSEQAESVAVQIRNGYEQIPETAEILTWDRDRADHGADITVNTSLVTCSTVSQQLQDNTENELDTDDSEQSESVNIEDRIPVDDASPVTFSKVLLGYFQQLPDLQMPFNVKLGFLLFWIPFASYIHLGLYLVLRKKYTRERVLKQAPGTLSPAPEFVGIKPGIFSLSSILVLASFMLPFFAMVLFLKPRDFFVKQEMKCFLCDFCRTPLRKRTKNMLVTIPFCTQSLNSVSLGDKMLRHMKCFPRIAYALILNFLRLHNRGLKGFVSLSTCFLKINIRTKKRRPLLFLWLLFSSLFTLFLGIVWVALCFALGLVFITVLFLYLSPVMTLSYCIALKIWTLIEPRITNLALRKFLTIGVVVLFDFMLGVNLYFGVYLLCTLILGIFGFTLMGLVLNVDIVTPYVSFFLAVVTNVYFCYANFQRSYIEFKGLIFKYWQQETMSTEGSDQSTIPTMLFWYVSDRVLPVATEIYLMFCNMAFIVTFLFLTISSIVFFRNEYDISTLVSTIAVFISGAIPSLFSKGLTRGRNFTGWRKIELKREIKKAVRAYVTENE